MMKFNSIETYEKYKNDKKILKEIEKSKEALEKRKEFYKREREKYIMKQQLLIEWKTARRLQRDENKINLNFEKKIRKLQWKKLLKKHVKEKSPVKLKKELFTLIQLLARLQEVDQYGWGKCISCWKRIRWDQWDWWHYISRTNMSTAFDLRNIHLQCKNCNGNLHGNVVEYRKNLVQLYGEDFVKELEERKNQVKDYTIEELEALIEQTKRLIELEKQKFVKS